MITKNTNQPYFKHLLSSSICALLAMLASVISFDAAALGQLMVSPTRIVFEGNERTKQINLINNGSETGRFRISFVRRNMNSDGKIVLIEEGQEGMYSDEMVRFSPRQVTLQPGQSQTVRLMLRKKSGTADGEYRSHMLFQSLPDASSSDVNELASGESDKLSINLIPVVGITIPVIVRQGSLAADVSLSDFEIKQANTVKAQSVLSLKVNRKGDKSAYGDFRVTFTPKGGTPVVIGQINGIAVYTSTESRTLDIKLGLPKGFKLSNGELHVVYMRAGEEKNAGLIAESRLAVP
jgi:P pilus assembly chaperone PapD